MGEIATGVLAFFNQDKLTSTISIHLHNSIKNEYSIVPDRTSSIDKLQSILECCGNIGPGDWNSSKYNTNSNSIHSNAGIVSSIVNEVSTKVKYSVPYSCCRKNITRQQCEDSRSVFLAKLFNSNIYSEVSKICEYVKFL